MSKIANSKIHIFLTGDVQIGKSTVLRKIIKELPDKTPGGFITRWINKGSDKENGLYIFPATMENIFKVAESVESKETSFYKSLDSELITCKNLIACFGKNKEKVINPEVFKNPGVLYLNMPENPDFILMDEIGIFEDKSPEFIETVLDKLNGNIPVIGVVRNKPGILTDAIRTHGKVKIVDVAKENRDALPDVLLNEIKKQF